MSIFFLIILSIAVLHFVYDGIVLPSMRLKLRFQLFRLRDELRWRMRGGSENITGEVYEYLQRAINNTINLLPIVDLQLIVTASRVLSQDVELQRRINEIIARIDRCDSEDAKRLHKETIETVDKAFLFNTGAGLAYLVPLALVYAGFSRLSAVAKRIVLIPELEMERILPLAGPATA